MERLRALARFLKSGPFRGNHKIQYDDHSYAAVGQSETIRRMEAKEDRADVLASARADREATIAYNVERAAW